ncbi:hypothetical protein Wcon_00925 [Wolbachia endosymbiont of Cylisticus convexus]|nr:hypothetical protein Wcon_00925 [Wolbachia endosymbiont of Cylisticus convexus]
MEKKESNPDLIAPQHLITHWGMFLEILTDRINIMWREHLKREKDGKRDEKPNTRSDQ